MRIVPREAAASSRPLILHIAARFLPLIGGVETHVRGVIETLRDFDFVVIRNDVRDRPAEVPSTPGVVSVGPVWRTPSNAGLRRIFDMSAQSLAERIRWRNRNVLAKRWQPDLIHIHLLDLDYSWRLAEKFDLPGMTRSMVAYCAQLGGNPQKVLMTDHTLLAAPSTIVPETVKTSVLNAFDNIICVERSSYERALENQALNGRPRRVWYIPNSVDALAFSPRPFPESPPVRVGIASRIDKPGYDEVVSLAQLLPDFAELWVAFAGDEQAIREFRHRIQHTRIHVFSNVRPQDMVAFYSNIHVLFVQFPFSAIGRATLEAMASGRPVITFQRKGVDKYPVNQENGFLIQEWPRDMVAALSLIAENGKILETKGQKAREIIEAELCDARLLPKLAEVYIELSGV